MSNQSIIFSSKRFMILLKREINHAKRPFLYAIGGVFGGLSIGVLVQLFSNSNLHNTINIDSLVMSVAIMGIIWSSISFSELINPASKQQYLALPASTLEKILSKWSIVSILIPIFFMVCYILYSYAFTFVINALSTKNLTYAYFPINDLVKFILSLSLAQSIFFAGSVWMPKNSILKTGAGLVAVFFVIVIFTLFAMKIVFYDVIDGWSLNSRNIDGDFDLFKTVNSIYVKSIVYLITYTFFITVSYFKLKEKEL